jgi:hypothetical protein
MWLAGIYSQAIVPNEFRRHFRLGHRRPVGRPAGPAHRGRDPAGSPALDPTRCRRSTRPTRPTSPRTPTIVDDVSSAAGSLRAYGRDLYKHPAVKRLDRHPYEPLAAHELFGGRYVRPRCPNDHRGRAAPP